MEQNPLIVPFSARVDIQHGVLEAPTPPRLLSGLHCNTLICSQTTVLPPSPPPSPINHPSLHLLLFILHLPKRSVSYYSTSSSSVIPNLSHPVSPPSLHLCFLLLVASFFSGLSLFVPVYPHSSTRWFVLRFYI